MTPLLTHLVFDLDALNQLHPTKVRTATNAPGSGLRELEDFYYGPLGYDEPEGLLTWIAVPAHVAAHLTTHQAVVAYLLAKLGEIVGEDAAHGVEVVIEPDMKEFGYYITPVDVVQYAIPQDVPSDNERTFYPTFGQALLGAWQRRQADPSSPVDIDGWDVKGNIVSQYPYYEPLTLV